MDKALDEKYINEFIPFLQKEMFFFVDSNLEYKSISITQFENKYQALQLECQNLNPMSSNAYNLLKNIQNKVNYLIKAIEHELNN